MADRLSDEASGPGRPEASRPLRTDPACHPVAVEVPFVGSQPDDGRHAAYWLRREQAARTLAAKAADRHIAAIHIDMADWYAALARDMAEGPTK